MKTEDRKKLGKKNKVSGAIFEKRVRLDLEQKGWIVDKFTNTVKDGKLVPCQNRWNYFTKSLMMASGGFPDFIVMRQVELDVGEFYGVKIKTKPYEVIGVESKTNGYLKPEEKQKCGWLIDNRIFSKILIASKHKIKNRIHIEYKEWN